MLLLDENLSWRLVKSLQDYFPGTIHINETGLEFPISDKSIWEFAKQSKRTIITNDEDFLHLLMEKGFPPKVVLLKIGNTSTSGIVDVLVHHNTDIMEMIDSDVLGILEIY